MNNVSPYIFPEEGIRTPFLLHFVVFNWELLIIIVHKILIFKTAFLHITNTIYSILGGGEGDKAKPNGLF